jgi:TonB family protein
VSSASVRAQSNTPASPLNGQPESNLNRSIFIAGPNASVPELLPADSPVSEAVNCKKKLTGRAVLSFLVDATGSPRNIAFEEGSGSGLDELAYKTLSADRFKPATHLGAPVAVPMEDEIRLEACPKETKSSGGDDGAEIVLSAQPKQKLLRMTLAQEELEFASFPDTPKISRDQTGKSKDSVSAPVPLNSVESLYSDEARTKNISGVCFISLVVDANGMPRNLRVIRPLGYGLDQKALEAARKYRFKPAMRNGTPVPVMITVEVNFRLY